MCFSFQRRLPLLAVDVRLIRKALTSKKHILEARVYYHYYRYVKINIFMRMQGSRPTLGITGALSTQKMKGSLEARPVHPLVRRRILHFKAWI
jgi:hypothetical protein